jgi:arabinogalactan endo-1,4-beta-galactosidase
VATLLAFVRLRFSISILTVAIALAAVSPCAARLATQARSAAAPVPQGFVGVDIDGPLLSPQANVNLAHQLDTMATSGVESVRVAFNWAAAQPYHHWADVPSGQSNDFVNVGGVPTSFAATDQIVGLAAQHGLTVLPTVLYSPVWDAKPNRHGYAPPAKAAPYASYLTALVDRYGPHGTFWNSHSTPRLPVRMWQIWNEPNLSFYWTQPFAGGYVALLRAAHTAIKRADPGAKVVLAALTNRAWTYLGQIYKVRGARRLFDVIATNGFTATPSREILYLQLVRRAANHIGDTQKPILATELSWPSAKGKSPQHFDWNTTESGQASRIAELLPLLAANRQALRLLGFYYYTWIGAEYARAPAFNFAGLLRLQTNGKIVAKPALAAFRRNALALEGCRKKGRVATRCLKSG